MEQCRSRLLCAFLLLPAAHAAGCAACCHGNDCSRAFKGGEGKCCGVRQSKPYCCPGHANALGNAQCVVRGIGREYRCMAAAARDGDEGGVSGAATRGSNATVGHLARWPPPRSPLLLLVFGILFSFVVLMRCCRSPQAEHGMDK